MTNAIAEQDGMGGSGTSAEAASADRSKRDRQAGFNKGVRACIAWLHARAETMTDPHARLVLNGAAFNLGTDKPGTYAVGEGWQPIGTARIGHLVLCWHPLWRHPWAATPNSDYGGVWVDTCEPEARGWQSKATHWMPLPSPPLSEPNP